MQKEKKTIESRWTWVFGDAPGGHMKLMMMATQPFSTYGLVFCFTLDPTIVNSYVMD